MAATPKTKEDLITAFATWLATGQDNGVPLPSFEAEMENLLSSYYNNQDTPISVTIIQLAALIGSNGLIKKQWYLVPGSEFTDGNDRHFQAATVNTISPNALTIIGGLPLFTVVDYVDGATGDTGTPARMIIDASGNISIDKNVAITGDLVVTGAATAGTLAIGGGDAITIILKGSASLNFVSTPAGATQDLTMTLTGAVVGDIVNVGIPVAAVVTGAVFMPPFVSSANTITLRYFNSDVGAQTPGVNTFNFSIIRF